MQCENTQLLSPFIDCSFHLIQRRYPTQFAACEDIFNRFFIELRYSMTKRHICFVSTYIRKRNALKNPDIRNLIKKNLHFFQLGFNISITSSRWKIRGFHRELVTAYILKPMKNMTNIFLIGKGYIDNYPLLFHEKTIFALSKLIIKTKIKKFSTSMSVLWPQICLLCFVISVTLKVEEGGNL